MANSLSAEKRIRQNVARRARNRARKGVVKTQIRKFTDAVRARDVDQAQAEFRGVVKKLDQTAAKGTLHKNTVARKKSRLAKQLNKLTAAQQG
ncbi:MAG: 30S ribosomal protein S20 [Planctomycetota bacterium]